MRALFPLLLLVACSTPAPKPAPTPPTKTPAPPPSPYSTKPSTSSLRIVHIGDSEAGLLGDVDKGAGGVARAEAIIRALVAKGPAAVVVHAGDTMIPAPELTLEVPGPRDGKNKSALLAGNDVLGVQAAAFGNHDLDMGETFAKDAIAGAPFPWVTSTLIVDGGPLAPLIVEDQTPWVHESAGKILRRAKLCTDGVVDGKCSGGVVGLVGTSPEDIKVISKGAVHVSAPPTAEATLKALQPHVDALRAEGISVIVLLSHRQDVVKDLQLVDMGLEGVDVIVSGGGENLLASQKHRLRDGAERDLLCQKHEPCYPWTKVAKNGDAVLVVATEGDLFSVGSLVVNFDDDGRVTGADVTSRPWPVDEESLLELRATVDKKLLSFELSVRDALLPLRKIVGETPVELDGTREQIRNAETNLGDVSADAIATAARAERKDVKGALRNAGGIRNSIRGPQVSLLDVKSALRFDSKIVVVDVSHEDLARSVEASFIGAGSARGHFPQVSSDVAIVYAKGGADQQHVLVDGKVQAIKCDGSRLRSLVVGGEVVVKGGAVVDPKATLAVATIDYLSNGGDGWFPGQKTKAVPTQATEQSALLALLAEPAALQKSLQKSERIVAVDDAYPAPKCAP